MNFSYYSASKCFDGGEFRAAFNVHRTEGSAAHAGSLNFLSQLQSPVSWNQQLRFISSFPNFHRWQQNKVSFSQWLSIIDINGKYRPASARNQILFYFREGCLSKVYEVCTKLRSFEFPTQQLASSSTFVSTAAVSEDVDTIPSAPKRRRREPVKRLTAADLLCNITSLDPEFSARNLSQEATAYEKFKFAIIENGHVFWRRTSANVDIFAMNDVNMTTGLFQEDCYAHLTRVNIDGAFDLTCSCSMYTTLMQVACLGVSEQEFEEMDLGNVNCCHMRLFNELISDFLPSLLNNTSRSENNLVKMLECTKGLMNDPICHLPTPSNRSLKFSVYADHDDRCSVVHITDNRVCCQSGYCDALFSSSKRYVVNLDKAEVLCPHLLSMREQYNLWIDLLPKAADSVETGNMTEVENDQADDEDPQPPPPVENPVSELKVCILQSIETYEFRIVLPVY